ncbi:MAG: TIGR00730 family Rossman fold protein [Rhodospirillaceae bacterium]|nr:TIGR00730 family Rossman fold protein [Rhodospirillaceae bacterium]
MSTPSESAPQPQPAPDDPFPSAAEDAQALHVVPDTEQTRSPTFRLAYTDQDFLLRDELRPTRMQLELMKPEFILQEERIASTIVVFGSARARPPAEGAAGDGPAPTGRGAALSRYYEEARRFASLASSAGQCSGERSFVIVTGGGPGIMEAANRGAHEVGARSIGLSIVLPHEQWPNRYVTPQLSFCFHYFGIRKMHFLMRARALVCFPGGFGTMDELFETLTLIQTGRIAPIPVLLFDEAWWRRIVNFETMVEEGVIDAKDLGIFRYVDSAEAAWRHIAAAYGLA